MQRLVLVAFALTAACSRDGLRTNRCDVCPTGELCDSETGQCVPASAPDGGCTSNTSCAAPTRLCAADGRCVACLGNADCPQGTCDMQAGRCVAGAAESCGALTSFVDVGSAMVRLRGTTKVALDDATLGCSLAGAAGPDVLFGVRLAERRRLLATARAVDPASGFLPVVGVRTDCGQTRSELGCGFTSLGSDRASLTAELAAGSFFVWVDSETNVGGEFELELAAGDAPMVDTCSQPGALRGQDVDLTGETQGLADDVDSTCGGAGAPDAVYTLSLDRTRRVRIEASGASVGFRPVIAVRRRCAERSSEVACAPPSSQGVAVVELPALEAGDYAVIVDGASAQAQGRFRLRVTLSDPVPAPQNDTCATASPLLVLYMVSVQGDTTRATNDAVGCDATGPDLVYSLELTAASRLKALVTPLPGSLLQPVLYLRRATQCESQVDREQLFCVTGGQSGFPAQFDVPRLEPGSYFLFVDGKARTAGAFDLSVELGAPPAPPVNDTCGAATVLAVGQGPVFLPSETTVGARNDSPTCLGLAQPAPDVAYTLFLPTRQAVSIDARALPGSRLLPTVTLKPLGPCAVTAPLPLGRCGFSDLQVPDRAVLIEPSLDPGLYAVWVGGDIVSQGPFSLRVATAPPLSAPANDSCMMMMGMTSAALSVSATGAGDTRGADDTTDGRCGFPGGANGEFGNDVAFTLSVASLTPTLTITVQPDAVDGTLMRPVVYVRGGPAQNNQCTSQGPNLGCQGAPDFGAAASVTLMNVAPGTYTVWVDGAGLSAGAFSVSVR